MIGTDTEILSISRYYFKLDIKATEAYCKVRDAERDDKIIGHSEKPV